MRITQLKDLILRCDVSNREQVIVIRVAQKISEEVRFISVLINNASVSCCCPLREHTPTDIWRLSNINVFSHFWTIDAFHPHFIAGGRGQIIAMCSMAAFYAIPNMASYSATKFVIRGMMDALYLKFRQHPQLSFINFLTVHPFFVATDRFPTFIPSPVMPGLIIPKNVVSIIISAHRQGIREVSIPRSFITLMNLLNLFPKKAILLIKDFFRLGLLPEM